MKRSYTDHIRGLLTVVDSELEGSRRQVGAMLTLAENLDKTAIRSVLEEVERELVNVLNMVSEELDEPAPGQSFQDQNGTVVQEGGVYGVDQDGDLYDLESIPTFHPSDY